MPLAFPSHQGLIMPLRAWRPRAVDGVALAIGATMPDIVDFLAWPFRGELGQWLGHSLLGLAVACLPLGLALTLIARRTVRRSLLARFEDPDRPATATRDAGSVVIGALSHVIFDLITHCNFLLLWPWYTSDEIFPDWWCRAWFYVPVPIYDEPYPFGPHTVAWLILSGVGIWLFLRLSRRGT